MSNESKTSARRRKLGKITAWFLVIVGFFTLLPINVGKPNFLGSFTLCSYAPVATITVLVIALTVYWYSRKSDLFLLGAIFLLIVAMFSGVWAYKEKLPLDNVAVDITGVKFWIGTVPHYFEGPANLSSISLNVTLRNHTDRDFSDLHSEGDVTLLINDMHPESGYAPSTYLGDVPLAPHATTVLNEHVLHDQKSTNPEVWALFVQRRFTLTLTGLLAQRYYYAPSSLDEYARRQYSFVLASKPFSTSYTYQE